MTTLPQYQPTHTTEKSAFLPSEANLHPTLPEYTGRYDVRSRVRRTPKVIEPCMPLRGAGPAYLPHKWTSTVHPEGAVYFYSQGSLRVVTDDWVHNLDVEAVISLWAKLLEDLLFKSGVQTRPGLELYLQILGEECWYYFADFDHRSIFWLNQTLTDELSLPGAISDNHLRLLMEQHFWNHVSHFPAHFGGFEPRTIDELLTVFIHGQGDQMTSRTSTFPYDRDNCERFIKLLETSRPHSTSGHVVALVARVWKVIIEHRYQTHHGEEQARLDRDSEILEFEPRDGLKSSAWKAMLWFATLGAVTSHRKRFERTMNDELVYEHDWKLFLAQTTSENQRTQINASVVTIASAVFLTTAMNSSLLLSAATILAVSSLIASLCASRHIDSLETTSAAGSQYLMWFRSKLVNFDLAGSIHAVPSALLNWALFFFSMHIIFIIAGLPSRFPAYLVFIPLYITAFLLTFSIISRPRVFFRFKRPVNPDTILPV